MRGLFGLVRLVFELARFRSAVQDYLAITIREDSDVSAINEIAVRTVPIDFVGVPQGEGDRPDAGAARLFRVLPNPFSSSGKIEFEVPAPSQAVRLRVYDLRGRLVMELLPKQHLDPGIHSVIWAGTNGYGNAAAPGIYFLRLEMEGFVETVKIALVR